MLSSSWDQPLGKRVLARASQEPTLAQFPISLPLCAPRCPARRMEPSHSLLVVPPGPTPCTSQPCPFFLTQPLSLFPDVKGGMLSHSPFPSRMVWRPPSLLMWVGSFLQLPQRFHPTDSLLVSPLPPGCASGWFQHTAPMLAMASAPLCAGPWAPEGCTVVQGTPALTLLPSPTPASSECLP